ncbi:TetR/AcrR family transcriptional regulator [Saccharothrix violaceirubra]
MDVFWSKGYEGTSTQDLCEHTGLGRGSLYNAYGSKHALYEEALRRYADIGFGGQSEILDRPGSVRERLRALMMWVVDTDLDDPSRRGCLAVNAAVDVAGRDDAVAEQVRRQFARLEGVVADLISVGQRSGELSADQDPLTSARFFLGAYYGLRVLAKVVDDRKALVDVVEGALARL